MEMGQDFWNLNVSLHNTLWNSEYRTAPLSRAGGSDLHFTEPTSPNQDFANLSTSFFLLVYGFSQLRAGQQAATNKDQPQWHTRYMTSLRLLGHH
jgi:hypothetical protein